MIESYKDVRKSRKCKNDGSSYIIHITEEKLKVAINSFTKGKDKIRCIKAIPDRIDRKKNCR